MTTMFARLEKMDFSQQLLEVERVLSTCQPKITFWGGRVIEAADKKKSVYFDAIVQKVHDAARARCDADDLVPRERMIGLRIVKKLNEWDQNMRGQVSGLNLLTKLFYKIRNYSFGYTPQFYLGEMARLYFRAFSEQKITEQVGPFVRRDEGYFTHPDSDMSFIAPRRWCVREEKIAVLADRYTETI